MAGSSKKVVYAALVGNGMIAVTKGLLIGEAARDPVVDEIRGILRDESEIDRGTNS